MITHLPRTVRPDPVPQTAPSPPPAAADASVLYQDPATGPDLSAAIDAALANLEPAYYYPGSAVPVFQPTLLQFRDFSRFIAAAEPFALRAGLCKVIPPTEWKSELHDHMVREKRVPSSNNQEIFLDNDEFPIMRPIVQHFEGSQGIYKQYNVENHRRVNLAQFYRRCVDPRQAPPVPVTTEAHARLRGGASPPRPADPPSAAGDQPNGIHVDLARQVAHVGDPDRSAIHALPASTTTPATAADGTGDELPPDHVASYVDHFDALDRQYWRNLSFAPPMYGADIPGTLFPTPATFPTWNPRNLGSVLNRIDISMPGVNQPYLYLGMWKATFAWHVEDMDLYSINYLHFGQPKSWYCIPPAHRAKFERAAQGLFSEDARHCPEFLRHKSSVISPSILKRQYDVPVHRLVQSHGEFVITFPNGYHAGFNQGFNCAESVNFALPSWVPLGRRAVPCRCIGDSVRIAIDEFFPAALTETDYWQEQRAGTFNRQWVGSNSSTSASNDQSDASSAQASRKRSATPHLSAPVCKSPYKSASIDFPEALARAYQSVGAAVGDYPCPPADRCCAVCFEPIAADDTDAVTSIACVGCGLGVHKDCYLPTLATPPEEAWRCFRCHLGLPDGAELRCILCPLRNGPLYLVSPLETLRRLKRIRRSTYGTEFLATLRALNSAERAEYLQFAHPPCARLVTETAVVSALVESGDETVTVADVYAAALPTLASALLGALPLVTGYEAVPKARWNLKCQLCKGKAGACVQCAERRCCTAFHVGCLLRLRVEAESEAIVSRPIINLTDGQVFCAKHVP
ncbi:hypothetical protein IWQ60_002553 [Tieghemiomyces parasiticus]|uniref:[Histone H3]-trimethyl-L-lysine(9) demethylase n=1 Tax=Tieghemiomyces parasiticus TaxID=78921 RepID=A0A9W8AB26_9FUNG|nr:hypothetical protein IWQ60_002553 [Tieghemiomyces parasiticus]